METKGLSREGLKLVACITMLMDHVGIWLIPSVGLRLVGRIAFPLYCFMLAEGVEHTRNPRKYGLRLLLVLILSEIPFDLVVFGRITLDHQSVMVTLLLGFFMLELGKKTDNFLLKILIGLPFILLAEIFRTDYGGHGVLLILLLSLVRGLPHEGAAMALVLLGVSLSMDSFPVPVLGMKIPIELFSILAMIPLSLYSGRKATHSKALQWAFTLFYPAHLAVLALLRFM